MKTGIVRLRNGERSCGDFFTPHALIRLAIHGLICVIAFILGLCFSREALLVVLSLQKPPLLAKTVSSFSGGGEESSIVHPAKLALLPPEQQQTKSGRVHVGRHQILVRAWPHPYPTDTSMAYRLMEIIQEKQRDLYGTKEQRQLIVITPTHVRTFQALYISTLMHTLSLVPSPLIWIVIEAGGASEETAALLATSGLSFVHLYSQEAMPSAWDAQKQLRIHLRVEGLRYVRDQQLDGIVVFADDSNTYSLEFFDEVQKVKWVGAFSIGLLYTSGINNVSEEKFQGKKHQLTANVSEEAKQRFPIYGPVCNRSGQLIGWHAPNVTLQVAQGSVKREPNLVPFSGIPEWASFVLNARLLWDAEKPRWIQNWEDWALEKVDYFSPLDIVKDVRFVEPLANCGQYIWLWSVRDEAYANSKFPSRWILEPPLEVIVPSKHTPWTELMVSPSISTVSNNAGEHNKIEKHKGKHSTRVMRGKKGPHHSDKRKHRNNGGADRTRQ